MQKEDTKEIHQQFNLFILFTSTDNTIGETGVKLLSEVLKLNTTLTTLDTSRKCKEEDTKEINQQITLFHSLRNNRQRDRSDRSKIIE